MASERRVLFSHRRVVHVFGNHSTPPRSQGRHLRSTARRQRKERPPPLPRRQARARAQPQQTPKRPRGPKRTECQQGTLCRGWQAARATKSSMMLSGPSWTGKAKMNTRKRRPCRSPQAEGEPSRAGHPPQGSEPGGTLPSSVDWTRAKLELQSQSPG